jgi:hypothetical protein
MLANAPFLISLSLPLVVSSTYDSSSQRMLLINNTGNHRKYICLHAENTQEE